MTSKIHVFCYIIWYYINMINCMILYNTIWYNEFYTISYFMKQYCIIWCKKYIIQYCIIWWNIISFDSNIIYNIIPNHKIEYCIIWYNFLLYIMHIWYCIWHNMIYYKIVLYHMILYHIWHNIILYLVYIYYIVYW